MYFGLGDAILFDSNNSDTRSRTPTVLLGRDFFEKFPHIVGTLQLEHQVRENTLLSSGRWYKLFLDDKEHVMAHLDICVGAAMVNGGVVGVGVYFEQHSAYNSFATLSRCSPYEFKWNMDIMGIRAFITGVNIIINAVENQFTVGNILKKVIVKGCYGNLLACLKNWAKLATGLKGVGLERALTYANHDGMFDISFETTTPTDHTWRGWTRMAAKFLALSGSKMDLLAPVNGLNLMRADNEYDLFGVFWCITHVDESSRIWSKFPGPDYIYVGADGIFECPRTDARRAIERADVIGNNKGLPKEVEADVARFEELELDTFKEKFCQKCRDQHPLPYYIYTHTAGGACEKAP